MNFFAHILLMWTTLCQIVNVLEAIDAPVSEYWDVNTQKGIMRGQSLKFRKIKHPTNHFHTCYEVRCDGKACPADNSTAIYQFCYPAIIITGLPKCGTSAMYDLLSKIPNAVLMHEKENCPSTRKRSHWQYFHSLPAMGSLTADSILIDGCIDIVTNIKMRVILRHPEMTNYVVMIRDYADMLWSSYNFWCKTEYDGTTCDYSKWADPRYHKRSPQLFHDLLLADSNGTEVVQPFYYPMHRPCANAGGYYSEYIDFYLYRNGLRNRTIIVASEELESYPLQVVTRVARFVGASTLGIDLQNFTKVRINSQENKGATHSVAIERYRHGVYNISRYLPMLPATREFVNRCWREDCLMISRHTGYNYSACINSSAAGNGASGLISLPLGLNNV